MHTTSGKVNSDLLPQGETLQQVMAAAARILGGDVSPDQPLMEAGLDSLGARCRKRTARDSSLLQMVTPCKING